MVIEVFRPPTDEWAPQQRVRHVASLKERALLRARQLSFDYVWVRLDSFACFFSLQKMATLDHNCSKKDLSLLKSKVGLGNTNSRTVTESNLDSVGFSWTVFFEGWEEASRNSTGKILFRAKFFEMTPLIKRRTEGTVRFMPVSVFGLRRLRHATDRVEESGGRQRVRHRSSDDGLVDQPQKLSAATGAHRRPVHRRADPTRLFRGL